MGKRWVTAPAGRLRGSPSRTTSLAARVRAAPTETCWPSTARTAVSNGSALPGTRSPGRAATSLPRSGSRLSPRAMASGSEFEVEEPAAAPDHAANSRHVVQAHPEQKVTVTGFQAGDRRSPGGPERPGVGPAAGGFNGRDGPRREEGDQGCGRERLPVGEAKGEPAARTAGALPEPIRA